MQEAAQDAADATAQATAGRVSAAQEKAGSAQARLARASVDLPLEQAGLAASAPPETSPAGHRSEPSTSTAPKPGAPATPISRTLNFTGFPARERAVLEQSAAEKYRGDEGARIEQYLRNLADERAER